MNTFHWLQRHNSSNILTQWEGLSTYITRSNETKNGAHHVIARTSHLYVHLLSLRFQVGKAKQTLYRSGQAQRIPAGWGSQITWRHMVVRLSALRSGRLYPLISVTGWDDPRPITRPDQQHYFHISHTKIHPNRTMNLESNYRTRFEVLNKKMASMSRYSRNSKLKNKYCGHLQRIFKKMDEKWRKCVKISFTPWNKVLFSQIKGRRVCRNTTVDRPAFPLFMHTNTTGMMNMKIINTVFTAPIFTKVTILNGSTYLNILCPVSSKSTWCNAVSLGQLWPEFWMILVSSCIKMQAVHEEWHLMMKAQRSFRNTGKN
jgi:hypothetical protein